MDTTLTRQSVVKVKAEDGRFSTRDGARSDPPRRGKARRIMRGRHRRSEGGPAVDTKEHETSLWGASESSGGRQK